MRSCVRACLMALLLGAWGARAQAPTQLQRQSIQAVRVQVSPVLDAVLDDPAWQQAPFVSLFTQKEPLQGEPATQRTEVAFVYDDRALYVGARMFSDHAGEVAAVLTHRDETGPAERLIISLDTWHDRRTAYSFAITAAGVRADWFHPTDNEYDRDRSFDPVWEARTRLTPFGWVAELRIPFSQLRFSAAEEQVWGVNLNRYVPLRNEDDFWVVVPRDVTGWASWFGELHGIRGVAPSHRIELLPYVAGDFNHPVGEDPRAGTPFEGLPPYSGRVGLDARVGLGPNLTLDATINPDFGQVEQDPAQVNLTAFELTLAERRPFFMEGSQFFSATGGPTWFYSRRIGAAPRLAPTADYAEVPLATTLLGAARLTGRLPSGLSVGGLAALTDESWANTYDFASGQAGRTLLEPRTGWGVLRLQQELGPGGSVVGATLTGLLRDNLSGQGLTGLLVHESLAGGADWNLRFRDGEYVFSGYAGGSYQHGSPDSILGLQTSSARYYQRPDQDYVHLDPNATSLSGYTAGVALGRQSGAHWLWSVGADARSPGFEINDVGQLLLADMLSVKGSLTWRETRPGPLLHGYSLTLATQHAWDYGGAYTGGSVGLNASGTLPNFWQATARAGYYPRSFSDFYTRGGPRMQTAQAITAGLGLSNSPGSANRWSVRGGASRDELGFWSSSLKGSLVLQPVPSVRLSAEPSVFVVRDYPQYVATVDGGRPETYGQRFVFATVRRSDLSVRLRASVYLTPDLSLEAYAEPFASEGRFSDFGELEFPGSLFLRRYGAVEGTSLTPQEDGSLMVADGGDSFALSSPDFNVRFFRSNVVLRWEWRPGSTLYLVWQEDRYQPLATWEALSLHGLADSLRAPGRYLLAVKISWWIPAG